MTIAVSKCHSAIFVVEICARSLNSVTPSWCAFPECESTTERGDADAMLERCRARFPENQFRLAIFRRVSRLDPQQFAADGNFVYNSADVAARASSATMAKRIANALNVYQTDKRGQ